MFGSLVPKGYGVDLDFDLDVGLRVVVGVAIALRLLLLALRLGLLILRHFAYVCCCVNRGIHLAVRPLIRIRLARLRRLARVLLRLFLLHVLGTCALEGMLLLLREGTHVAEVSPAEDSLRRV